MLSLLAHLIFSASLYVRLTLFNNDYMASVSSHEYVLRSLQHKTFRTGVVDGLALWLRRWSVSVTMDFFDMEAI